MNAFEKFQARFKFFSKHAFKFGIEREFFLADREGRIVPMAKEVYEALYAKWGDIFTYELSACQIESRSEIVSMELLLVHLGDCEQKLDRVLGQFGLQKLYLEVAPDDMPLDVYPDPSGRYARLKAEMSREILLAACRVAGTHVHVGMPDAETALRVYNRVISHSDELCLMGDNSEGRRLRIYRQVAPQCDPEPYESWEHFHEVAQREGFANNPRNCWRLIRLTRHGTIEFRMFGVTESLTRVVEWAMRCRNLCLDAI
jgi:carboxylate-amine ligase